VQFANQMGCGRCGGATELDVIWPKIVFELKWRVKVHYLFLDTCVWLTLCSKQKYKSLIATIVRVPPAGDFAILTNDYVISEFNRNVDANKSRYVSSLKSALDNFSVLEAFLTEGDWKIVREKLSAAKANEKALVSDFERMAGIIKTYISSANVTKLPIEDALKLEAIDRAVAKLAPMHRNKNSVVDTIHLLSFNRFYDSTFAGGNYYHFITENSEEFSSDTDRRVFNEGLNSFFSKANVKYQINVAETLNAITPGASSESVIQSIDLERYYCKDGLGHVFEEKNGAFLRSQYGGLTWQIRCSKCGKLLDTGDFFE
jgi:hypothetical protein